MHLLRAAYERVIDISGAAPGFIVALIAIGITTDVVARNTGLGGIAWMLETVEYALYVLTFTGAAYALRRGRHVAIDFFAESLPRPLGRGIELFAGTVVAAVCLVLTVYSAAVTWSAWADNSLVFKTFTIPEWVPLAYLLPTLLLLTVEALLRLAEAWRDGEETSAGEPRRGD